MFNETILQECFVEEGLQIALRVRQGKRPLRSRDVWQVRGPFDDLELQRTPAGLFAMDTKEVCASTRKGE